MTKKEAIKHHRRMWNWLAETGSYHKHKAPELKAFPNLKQDCFLCDYSERKIHSSGLEGLLDNMCRFCPLEWPGGQCCAHNNNRPGLYNEWYEQENIIRRKEIALEIANLPEKGGE